MNYRKVVVRMNNRKISLNSDKKTINIILGFLLIIILLKIASSVTEKVMKLIFYLLMKTHIWKMKLKNMLKKRA